MEIQFKTKLQSHIADLLWKTDSSDQVKRIYLVYGKEALVVHHMMIAHALDENNNTDLAMQVIRSIK